MSRDQAIGTIILVGSIIIIAAYLYGIFLTNYAILLLKLTGAAAIAGIFGILAWIGYTLATTPPPAPIEEIEKEIEEELEKTEKEKEEKKEEKD